MIVTAKCTNLDCGNAGYGIDLDVPEDEQGSYHPDWNGVFCGGVLRSGGMCGRLIHANPLLADRDNGDHAH